MLPANLICPKLKQIEFFIPSEEIKINNNQTRTGDFMCK
jgi:hypothetical protein